MLGLRHALFVSVGIVAAGCPAGDDSNTSTTQAMSVGSTSSDSTTGSATDPTDPTNPTDPTTPTNPTDPTDPTTPGDSTGNQGADCCTAHAGGGCEDAAIEACVCEEDAVCCTFDWDALCVNTARTRCEACGGGGGSTGSTGSATTTGVADTGGSGGPATSTGGGVEGACCQNSDTPGCPEDIGIETCVCGMDDFCCMTAWDNLCVDQAIMNCGANCVFDTGCCVPHPSPGCDDAAVETCVCAADPFCCMEEWDPLCVDEAQDPKLMCGMCP